VYVEHSFYILLSILAFEEAEIERIICGRIQFSVQQLSSLFVCVN
jgi:hypothetical protein